jgi:hypothetical protein
MVRSSKERSAAFYGGCFTWFTTCIFLVNQDFGVLAFCGSVFLTIWFFGLREKFSSETTASAYSVFNKNERSIAGTFTGQQLDRQLRGGISITTSENHLSTIPKAQIGKSFTNLKIVDKERLRRRKAAALAAERRIEQDYKNPDFNSFSASDI